MKPFYLSTAIPYVNADPHIGFALECVQADAIARYQRLAGNDVFFLSGTDENSLKNVQAAEKAGEPVETFVEKKAKKFLELKTALNLSFSDFIRTTEDRHIKGAQKLWQACKPEDIYKKKYSGLYCVGCEAFYTPDELENGLCPEHKVAPDVVEEENYFFKLSNYQAELEKIIDSDAVKITPDYRKNEVTAFIKRGLDDFSISRSVARARGWGVPVPRDESQIMYVWFDALSNYINALGFATEGEQYQKYWVQAKDRQILHVIGKGITRFHAMYWIAMLLSAKVPLPTNIFVHGYMTSEGQKMSKSLGNTVDPFTVVEKYGTEPVRYYLLGAIPAHDDGDFSYGKFEEYYTAHLANGVGNLTSRILTMLEKYTDGKVPTVSKSCDWFDVSAFWQSYDEAFSQFQFDRAVSLIQSFVTACDGIITKEKPWEQAKQGKDIAELLGSISEGLRHIALALLPVIPESAEKILAALGSEEKDTDRTWGHASGQQTKKLTGPLFPRFTSSP